MAAMAVRPWAAPSRFHRALALTRAEESNLTEDHMYKLNSIAFKWAVRKGRSPKKNAAPKKTAASKKEFECNLIEDHF